MKVLINESQKYLMFPYTDGVAVASFELDGAIARLDLRECKAQIKSKIKGHMKSWASMFKPLGVNFICFEEDTVDNSEAVLFPIDICVKGATMNIADTENFNFANTLRRAGGKHTAVISMLTDASLWTTDMNLPYEGISYPEWVRRNQEGHIPDELRRYKEQLARYGRPTIDVSQIDWSDPHLKGFAYNAYWLGSRDRNGNLDTELSLCVNAWLASFHGEPVRIVQHVRPPEIIR